MREGQAGLGENEGRNIVLLLEYLAGLLEGGVTLANATVTWIGSHLLTLEWPLGMLLLMGIRVAGQPLVAMQLNLSEFLGLAGIGLGRLVALGRDGELRLLDLGLRMS